MRIMTASLSIKINTIDHIPQIAGKGDAISLFGGAGARLDILSRHAPHLHHRLEHPRHQRNGHLHKGFEIMTHHILTGIGKSLGTITTLQQHRLPARHQSEIPTQRFNLPIRHQRQSLLQSSHNRCQSLLILIGWLMASLIISPSVFAP